MSEIDPLLLRKRALQRYELPQLTDLRTESFSDQEKFVNTLIRAFEEDPSFHISEFSQFPVTLILDYIRKTHRLYLDKTLQEIEQSIVILGEAYTIGHPLLQFLNDFFIHYKTDLIRHIREEDEKLIPHIEFLFKCRSEGFDQLRFFNGISQFSIIDFLEHHHDNEIELEEVRHKILEYQPPTVNQSMYRVLLNQLEFFGHDLRIHGLIEEQVLVPMAMEWERMLLKEFSRKVKLN